MASPPDIPAPGSPAPDILVLGGGLVGLACARELRRRGARVELWERLPENRAPGCEGDGIDASASSASAGMLAPLAEVPDDDGFCAVCRDARDAWTRWAPELESETGIGLDYDRSGTLILDEDGLVDELKAAAERLGEPFQELAPDDACARAPDLAPADPSKGEPRPVPGDLRCLLLPGEHRVDNRRVCRALRQALADSGVMVRHGLRARAIESGSGGTKVIGSEGRSTVIREAGRVLVAAGAWSTGTGDQRIEGLPTLPVEPVRGQMLSLEGIDWPFGGCIRARHHYAVRRRGDRLLVGATVERVGWDARVTPAGLEELLAFLRRFLPGTIHRALGANWAGLRPGSPDGRPLLGPLAAGSLGADPGPGANSGLWLAAGHYRNGVLLTPWTARTLASWMLDDRPPSLAEARLFAVDRFASPDDSRGRSGSSPEGEPRKATAGRL